MLKNHNFLLFPQCFLLYQGYMCYLGNLLFDMSFSLALSQTGPGFYVSAVQVF